MDRKQRRPAVRTFITLDAVETDPDSRDQTFWLPVRSRSLISGVKPSNPWQIEQVHQCVKNVKMFQSVPLIEIHESFIAAPRNTCGLQTTERVYVYPSFMAPPAYNQRGNLLSCSCCSCY